MDIPASIKYFRFMAAFTGLFLAGSAVFALPVHAEDEIEIETEAGRISNPVAVFSGLDKITGRITSFDVRLGETYQFGALQVTPRSCFSSPADEAARTDGFVEVNEITLDKKIKRIFTGWMFADSPGLNAVEHSIYDVWLKSCKQQ
ncbi:MAG: Hypothetical protein BHV28_08890 [Candidatus Tokpelaia hoelldobleri]|uniref:Cellulase-like protein n=1 Tax=Candidatus Tokpelaia hoelldobleri TaxID=1902579 RepID=A0A1U9JUR3_9HYPH|nr:MAG: Hypothetical protein BHV28_08890 [Candidatus Tokpelaia hoelldoblerii]